MCRDNPRNVPPPRPVPLTWSILAPLTETIAVPVPSDTTSAFSLFASEVPPIPIAANSFTLITGNPNSDSPKRARTRTGRRNAAQFLERQRTAIDQFAERAGSRRDRIISLDRDDVDIRRCRELPRRWSSRLYRFQRSWYRHPSGPPAKLLKSRTSRIANANRRTASSNVV